MSGLELSRRLSAVKDATPVVFITAHDDPELRAQGEASDCAGYFRKTDSGADVLAAIRRAISLEDSNAARKPGIATDLEESL
jgi:DNA-binding NarL/FixJ family response regulator